MIISTLRAVLLGIYYDLKVEFRYRFSLISDIVVFTLLMLFFLSSETGFSLAGKYGYDDYKALLLLGYIAWSLAVTALSASINSISGELQRGTFYRKVHSKCFLPAILFGDLISQSIVQLVVITFMLLFAFLIWHIIIPLSIYAIVAIAISTIGMYGIGLIVGGICIRVKRVGSIVLLLQLCLLFVTDTIPTNKTILLFTKILPLTTCNEIIRGSMSGENVASKFLFLIGTSLIWLIAGSIILRLFIRAAKKKGVLLFY